MSGIRQSQRPSKVKRELEELSDNNAIAEATPVPAKRQRIAPAMSVHAAIDPPDSALQAIAFLFGSRFSDALQVPAERVANDYNITKENAIEELRRRLVDG
ncbi:hypothetical protein EG329_003962 [Mollisiaceae sp. DMI_Dod_QoI]|nr:hypothetical protein EG329_003962 [Helotiales sp. DMI_Dod_QoI]